MENIVSRTDYPREREKSSAIPLPLGYIALAFTTALIGCSFAHFLIPTARAGIGLAIGAMLLFGGIVQFLAGMLEYRRGNTLPATVFAAYGGFLATFGLFLLPASGLASFFGLDSLALNHALGLLFLCWLVCIGVLLVASPRTHLLLTGVLAVLGLAYLFLTIGEFANGNTPLLMIGGWLGIVCALLAWYAALASLLSFAQSPFKLPMEQMA
ncbi:MAG TPA: acetate uptake transporter [Ktedonobacteraceae bacterium]